MNNKSSYLLASKRFMYVCLTIVVLLHSTIGICQENEKSIAPGLAWKMMSEQDKEFVLVGYSKGLWWATCLCQHTDHESTSGEQGTIEISSAACSIIARMSRYLEHSPGLVLQMIDELYLDPANAFIPFDDCINVASGKLSGLPTEYTDGLLTSFRSAADKELDK